MVGDGAALLLNDSSWKSCWASNSTTPLWLQAKALLTWMLQVQLTATLSASTALEERWYAACVLLVDAMSREHGSVKL